MNTFITPNWVTTDTAVNFKNKTKLIGRFDRTWEKQWEDSPDGAQIGYTVQVRIPQRFLTTEGQALQVQGILNQTVPMTINHQFQTAMEWSSVQSALEVEYVQQRYTMPAGASQASKWDTVAGAEVYKQVAYSIGAPGVPLSSNQNWTDAAALMMNVAVPDDSLMTVVDPNTQSAILNNNFALFQPKNEWFKTGQFSGSNLGIQEWFTDPNMPMHTTGTFTSSSWAVVGGGQTGSTLSVDGAGTYALKAGDVFRIDGVYTINPVSYNDIGRLQDFTLLADQAGSSTATLAFSPSIIPPGSQISTVTNSPADNAAITFLGSTGSVSATMAAQRSKQSLVFNPGAFAFVMADLPSPLPGANSSRKNDKDAGISLRWVEQYNIQTDQLPRRVDSIGGFACILPYFAIRMWS